MIGFTNPWGLLALLAVPAIVAIHLYRRRFPRLAVAGAFLWGGESEVRDAGRTRDRLPLTSTLLLEVLAALLLALVLSQPRFGSAGRVPHLVAVLDDSASMGAVSPEGHRVRDAAMAALESRLDALGRRAVVTVITTGQRPALLVGPAARREEARTELAPWRPQATAHDPAPAWDLAAQLAGDEGRMLFLTDRPPAAEAPLPQAMEVVAVGKPAANVALAAARWRRDSATERGTVAFRVNRFATTASTVTITGTAREQVVFEQRVSVAAQGSVPLEFAVPEGIGRLTITARAPDDALAIDNTVTLVEPGWRLVRVAIELPEGHAALRPLRRALEGLPAVEFATREEADLRIAPGDTLPEANPDLWWLGVGPSTRDGDDEPVTIAGPYVIDKRDPLADGLVLDGVIWGGVRSIELAVSPIVSAGRFPLLSRLDGTPTKAYLLNVDLARSNLADSPDWPILMANLVEAVRDDRPGLRRWNYRSGETVTLRLPPEVERGGTMLTLAGPDGERPVARTGTVSIGLPATPGLYALRDGETTFAEFAVHFQDDAESDLTDRRSEVRAPEVSDTLRGVTLDTIYSWPLLAALACALAAVVGDWYVLGRRRVGL